MHFLKSIKNDYGNWKYFFWRGCLCLMGFSECFSFLFLVYSLLGWNWAIGSGLLFSLLNPPIVFWIVSSVLLVDKLEYWQYRLINLVVFVARVIMDRETGRSRGFGFVTYTSSEEASSAIQALDGQVMLVLWHALFISVFVYEL